jgi:hypothetical protein
VFACRGVLARRDPNPIDPMDDPRMRPEGAPKAKSCTPPSWCPAHFCQPSDNESMARHQLNKMRLTLLAGIDAAVNPRVVPVWATYRSGGASLEDFTPRFGNDFANSPQTAKTTEFLVPSWRDPLGGGGGPLSTTGADGLDGP